MKRIFSILFLVILVVSLSFGVSASDYCGVGDGSDCSSGGEHCCTNIGPAEWTWSHTVEISSHTYTCDEYTIFRYESFYCLDCPNHWHVPEDNTYDRNYWYIEHGYMHTFDYSCTGLTYIYPCTAAHH